MKKLLLFTFLVTAIGFSQQKKEMDSKYYLLGTLSDYIGRNQFSNDKDVIESYAAYEKPLVKKIMELYKNNSIIVDTLNSNTNQERYNLSSKSINKSINSFYNFDKYSLTYPHKDTIFKGKLKDSIFQKDSEKMSFLLGCLSRFSSELVPLKSNEFCLQYSNSISKFVLSQKIITDLGFTINKVETLPNIPRINRIYFAVDESNYELFKEYNLLGIEIQNNLINHYSRSKKRL
jgi:hypothetical protein